MPKQSSATYVSGEIAEGQDEIATLQKLRDEAKQKTGLRDGESLTIMQLNMSGKRIGATYVREWDEPDQVQENADADSNSNG